MIRFRLLVREAAGSQATAAILLALIWACSLIAAINCWILFRPSTETLGGDWNLVWPNLPPAALLTLAAVLALMKQKYLPWSLAGCLVGLASIAILGHRLTGLETGWIIYGAGATFFGWRTACEYKPIGRLH